MAQSLIGDEDLTILSSLSDDISFLEDNTSGVSDSQRSTRLILDEAMFEEGSYEYRKARKRRQNRESAARSRMTKQNEVDKLRIKVQNLNAANSALKRENRTLRSENAAMKRVIKDLKHAESKGYKKAKAETDDVQVKSEWGCVIPL